jgi:hypothetical protein
MQGFCIVPGAIDAPKGGGSDAPHADAPGTCPAGCTSCNVAQKTCVIDCQQGGCDNQVVCPTGYHCDIACDTANSCRSGVNCVGGASCTIQCTGDQSCRNIACGPGRCDVTCSGPSSCRGVQCNNSCACDVLCTGLQSCTNTIACTAPACDVGLGCSSAPTGCHSCQ